MSQGSASLLDRLSKPTLVADGQINPPEFTPGPDLVAQATEGPAAVPGEGSKDVTPQIGTKDAGFFEKVAAAQEPANSEKPTDRAPPPAKPPIRTLYLGCFPIGGKPTVIEAILEQAKATINEEGKVADYRFLPFGQGPGVLSQAVMNIIHTIRPKELVVCNLETPEVSACLVTLMANAEHIIRSVR